MSYVVSEAGRRPSTMSDQTLKKDAGKARPDLIPWAEITVLGQEAENYTPGQVLQAMKLWWTAKPHALAISIPARQLPGIAQVLAFGAEKYAPRGWEAGIPFSRVFAAAARHATAWAAGEHLDAESGLAHEAHFWCNVLFLAVLTERGRTDLDDRPAGARASVEKMDSMRALFAQLTGQTAVSAAGLAGDRGGN